MRILLVDDDPTFGDLMAAHLRGKGHEVEVALCAEAARRGFRSTRFDLVVLDWVLPDGDGLELARWLRREPRGADCLVLLLTGTEEPDLVRAALEAGVDDYLPKRASHLLFQSRLAILERHLASERARREAEARLREEAERLASVVRAQTEIGAAPLDLDAEGLRAMALEQACRLTAADGASLLLPEDGDMVFTACRGCLEPVAGHRQAMDGSLAGACFHSGRILVCPDTEADARIVDRRATRMVGVRSLMAVPLRAEGRAVGVLTVAAERVGHFGSGSVAALQLLSGFLGSALVHQEAYAAQRRHLEAQEASRAELMDLAEQLARSNRDLEHFASVASHDLQEPLRKIQMFGDRLLARHIQSLDGDGRAYLLRMTAAAARLQALIRDLLALARVGQERRPMEPVDLGSLVSEVVSDLEMRMAQERGEVRVGFLPVVEGDRTQLRQLLQNLLDNALKYHRPGIPPRVQVRGWGEGPWAVVEVEDNGVGFEPEAAGRIFGLFQRLHGRAEFEGTGVGLALCRRIAEHHGGGITATARPGQGACFTLRLPLGVEDRSELTEPGLVAAQA